MKASRRIDAHHRAMWANAGRGRPLLVGPGPRHLRRGAAPNGAAR